MSAERKISSSSREVKGRRDVAQKLGRQALMYCMMGRDLRGQTLWQKRGRLSAALAGRRRQ